VKGEKMFDPKIISDLQASDNPVCTSVAAPSCASWWNQNSECTCSHGCITPAWTNTSTNV